MKKTKKMLFLELNLMDYLMKTLKKSMKFIYPHAINSFKTGDEAERKNLGDRSVLDHDRDHARV